MSSLVSPKDDGRGKSQTLLMASNLERTMPDKQTKAFVMSFSMIVETWTRKQVVVGHGADGGVHFSICHRKASKERKSLRKDEY